MNRWPVSRFRHASRRLIGALLLTLVGQMPVVALAEERPFIETRSLATEPVSAPQGKADFRALALTIAKEKDLPFELLDAVMRVESNYNPKARGGDGEVGLMQVMPPTARLLGFDGTLAELADPETNIRLGARYLGEAWRLSGRDVCTAVMKYRAGWRETRFSVLSVRYCVQVRTHLASLGFPLTGSVPEPTFGFRADEFHQGVQLGSIAARRRLASGKKLRSRVNWAQYDQRMKALGQ
jgi:Transglycosylase SLT domain